MKYIVSMITAFLLLPGPAAIAQEAGTAPVHAAWDFSAEKKGPREYTLKFKAKIDAGWKLLATTQGDDLNTRIAFDSLSDTRAAIQATADAKAPLSAKEPLLDNAEIKYFENEAEVTATIQYTSDSIKDLRGTVHFFVIKGEEILPEEAQFTFKADAAGNLAGQAGWFVVNEKAAEGLQRTTIDLKNPVMNVGGIGNEGESSVWLIFVLGFLGGLVALVTPCVFPMIPLTVSFFTKSAQDRKSGIFNATMYGFFIFLIYVLFSVPFHIAGKADSAIFNNISTNIWLNLIFFVVFVVFALSFFGFYEITLPSGLASKADSKANKNSLVGIFFMALTLVVVSFSCTGPIMGSLLAGAGSAASGGSGAWMLTAGMAGFGLALALPFALFALFPNWLSSLPKSGGWLTDVKVVLGFVELALAVKFLSNADLVAHWGILHRETFFLIWIAIFAFTTAYLFGWLRKRGTPKPKMGKVRLAFGILFGAFTLYLIPGVTNSKYARLRLMSGFAPPMSYSWYGHHTAEEKGAVEPDVMNDYEKGLALAKEQNKPVLLDFTGWACVNCRNMEENVWTDPEVHALIKDNYILVSLYTDDRKKLSETEQFLYESPEGWSKKIVTIGDKYATFQRVNFINQSQPLYVLITPDERLLTLPVAYTPDIQEYANWLKAGLEGWKKVNGSAK